MSLRPGLRNKPVFPPSELLPEALEGARRRILETALALFATKGFAGTSVRDITNALELQPSALYAHFASKEELLAELARVGHAAQEVALLAAFNAASGGPVEQLRALVRTNSLLHATYPHLAVVVNEELHALSPELAGPSVAIRMRVIGLLADVLQRGKATKAFSIPNLTVTGAAIAAMTTRIPYWYVPQPDLAPEKLAEHHVELAFRMVGVTDTVAALRPKRRRR